MQCLGFKSDLGQVGGIRLNSGIRVSGLKRGGGGWSEKQRERKGGKERDGEKERVKTGRRDGASEKEREIHKDREI